MSITETIKSTVQQISDWFTVSTPDPTHQNFNTQMGVHFEEFAEMLETVTGHDEVSEQRVLEAHAVVHALANDLKAGTVKIGIHDAEGFLDAACDQIVTATGASALADMEIVPAIQDVADSNDSKFVDGKPVRDPVSQKIMKGPNYWRVNLAPYVQNAKFVVEKFVK